MLRTPVHASVIRRLETVTINHAWAWIAALILIGIAVRIPLILSTGAFADEGTLLAKALDVANGKVLYLEIGDNRPPLVTLSLSFILRLFRLTGDVGTLIVLRSLFSLSFMLVSPLVYAIGRDVFSKPVGLLAVFFFIFEPLLIGQSIQVIPEIPALGSTIVGVYFLVHGTLGDKPRKALLYASGFWFALSLLSHAYSLLSIGAVAVYLMAAIIGHRYSWSAVKERLVLPIMQLLSGAVLPLAIAALVLALAGSWDAFLTGMNSTATTTQMWHSVDFDQKLEYLRYTVLSASSISIWLLGFVGLGQRAVWAKRSALLVLVWFAMQFSLTLFLPQSPGYPPSYVFAVVPLALLASISLVLSISSARRLIHRLALACALIVITFFGFYGSLDEITDPGHTVTITTPPLSDQLSVASFIRDRSAPDGKLLTFTPSYAFLADMEVVNHFTFGPEFATQQQIVDSIVDREISFALLDARTIYRLRTHYPGNSMSELSLSVRIKVTDAEDQRADGVTLIVRDDQGNMLNHWVHVKNWQAPALQKNVAHTEVQVEEGQWTLVQVAISEEFMRYFGYYPAEITLSFVANANGGSSVKFLVDEVVVSNDGSLLLYNGFEEEAQIAALHPTGEGRADITEQGYESPHALELSATGANFLLTSNLVSTGVLGLVYRDFVLERTFQVKEHKSSMKTVPVEFWSLRRGSPPPVVVYEPLITAFRSDDGTRETAGTLQGSRQAKKWINSGPTNADAAVLKVLLQENGNAQPIFVSINGQVIGQILPRNLADSPSREYYWREISFDGALLTTEERPNTITLWTNPDEQRESGFWRIGADVDNSGSSFSSAAGSSWSLRDDELMIYVEAHSLAPVAFTR